MDIPVSEIYTAQNILGLQIWIIRSYAMYIIEIFIY